MDELAPGLWHWTAFRDTIRRTVHSAYVEGTGTLIDPMLPDEGTAWFAEHGPPERILLVNRHHLRHSAHFADAFGATVHCHETGLWDLHDAPVRVEGFRFGDELAPGIVAYRVATICPEETALHIAVGPGALAVADGVIRDADGRLAFVSDFLLGSDPEAVKRGLANAYLQLAETLEFDVLLLAHGDPWIGGAREALRAFAGQHAGAGGAVGDPT
ncbi:MAG TPA: hypothetical protein VFF79_19580 [Conexibacter sp.]|jgi:hypothetical protein|nr:hypothetical protein [Conexibacter sp.]